jgi:hypothetical protein
VLLRLAVGDADLVMSFGFNPFQEICASAAGALASSVFSSK